MDPRKGIPYVARLVVRDGKGEKRTRKQNNTGTGKKS
jgi:hypothetical protein